MYKLSKPQTAIYEMDRFGGGAVANIAGDMFFDGAVSAEDIGKAVNQFVRDCETMRTRIVMCGEVPMQETVPFKEEKIDVLSFDGRAAYAEWAKAEARNPVDLFGRLYTFSAVTVCGRVGLFCRMHHIIGDAWTMGLIAGRLCEYLKNGEAREVYPYTLYLETESAYESGKRYAKDREYWLSVYDADGEVSYLSEKQIKSNNAERKSFVFTKEQSDKIKIFCEAEGVTEYILFLSAVSAYFYRVTGRERFYVGTPVLNRSTPAERDTAGAFINTVPLSLTVDGDVSFANLCEITGEAVSSAFRHQKFHYSELLKTLRAERSCTDVLFDVMVSFQNMKLSGGAEISWYPCGAQTESLQIHIDDRNGDGVYHIDYDYQIEKFTEEEIERMNSHVLNLLFGGISAPEKKLHEIDILSADEYNKVVYDFNDTAVDYPKDKTVHQLFEEQVARTPDRTAVIACDKTLTYRELNEQANRIANELKEKGVKPGDIVALMLPRRSYLIAAMFGILKAGAAYMPIDISYSDERIQFMLDDTKTNMLVVSNCIDERNIDTKKIVNINELLYGNSSAPKVIIDSESLCYCIYTSGSTGTPKGTLLTHQGLNNFCHNNNNNNYQCCMLNVGKNVVATMQICFDVSVFEIFLSLLHGLKLVLANEQEMNDGDLLASLMIRNNVDILHATPTKIRMYCLYDEFCVALSNIKIIMIGAEVFTEQLYATIRRYTNAIIFNGYGPTETTIGVSFGKIGCGDMCIHKLFEEQVRKMPDKTAIEYNNIAYSYSYINNAANLLAQKLREYGVDRNDIVAIISERSPYIVISMIAIWKAGGAYVTIDPNYPEDRIKYILSDSHCKVILTNEVTVSSDIPQIRIKEIIEESSETHDNLINKNNCYDICCVIYTSGSTGTPKGAMNTHLGIVNFAYANESLYADCSKLISLTSYTFDAFLADVVAPIFGNITLVLSTEEERTVQTQFEQLIINNKDCSFFMTPEKLLQFIRDSADITHFNFVKNIYVGGDVFPTEIFEKIGGLISGNIYNVYGPCECSIWAVDFSIKSTDITIGKPIANTQIYILDKHLKPVPIGVAGELCISGDCVGAGYLNRPELTAEKFIPNPFGKGKMYKTGDIAKWREDGNIEYIGRNDFQVKIRGLRIELGEIENAVSQVEGVLQSVVVVRKDSAGRQLICAFYTGVPVEPSIIREEISKKLPKYMLPHIFTHLEKMPMTSSGKVSRTSLPEIDLENIGTGAEYEAPVTETEKKLCQIISDTLKTERIGLNDDFFELGGDSLKAIEFVSKAHAEGIYFTLQNVFDTPTVKTLCNFMSSEDKAHSTYSPGDFTELHRLLSSNTDDGFMPERTEVGDVLIVGATGFLGIHILAEFLETEKGKAYCLVRGKDENDAKKRFEALLDNYFGKKYLDLLGSRIIVLCGDFQKENLGLDIIPKIQTIINCAASVKHYGSYKYFYDANVQSVKNIIEAAKQADAVLLHTSTLSVSGNSFADEFDTYRSDEKKHFGETDLFIGQPLDNVYARSKFEAEKLILEEMHNGLKANIFRIGNLTNRSSDGMFQKNYKSNAFAQRVKGIIELGQCPDYLFRHYVEFTPIDEAAKAVMTTARYFNGRKTVFHINSTRVVYIDRLMALFNSLGVHVETVSGSVFTETLRAVAKQSETEYLFETFINDMDENEQLSYDSNIRIDNSATENYLRRLGFAWGDIGEEYLRKYIKWFRDIGYWRV